MDKLNRILEKLSLSIINQKNDKDKVYYTLLTTDNIIVHINFNNIALAQNSANTIEKQITKKIKKVKEKKMM